MGKNEDAEARKRRAERLREQIGVLEKKPGKAEQQSKDLSSDEGEGHVQSEVLDSDVPGPSPAGPDFRSFIQKRMRDLGGGKGGL